MTVERDTAFQGFKYEEMLTGKESFKEITVSLVFTFGLANPLPFTGHAWRITEEESSDKFPMEKSKMAAESFLEASAGAWDKYKSSSDPERIKFVKKTLRSKWKEMKGEGLINKKLKFK